MTTARPRQPKDQPAGNGDAAGYEADLWRMADALRGSMDAAEYKHVVLGLIFLKYISDAFEELHTQLERNATAAPTRKTETSTWQRISSGCPPRPAGQTFRLKPRRTLSGQTVDAAMTAVERDNPALKDVLPKDYAREALDKQRLGQVINLVGNINVGGPRRRPRTY